MEASWSMTLGLHIYLKFCGVDVAKPCGYILHVMGLSAQKFWRIIMSDANIPVIMKDIEEVMQATRTIVEAMQPGQRKQIKELANEVAATLSQDPKEVLSLISIFAHKTNIAYVTRGKNGGVVRGVKPAKTVKAGKKAKADDQAVNLKDGAPDITQS